MSNKAKSALLLVLVLILGVFIGMQGTLAYMRLQVRDVRWERPGPPIQPMLEHIIQPTPEQRKELEEIIDRYAERLQHLSLDYRQETRALLDSMQQEIEPLLTEEQKQRLEERRRRRPGGEWRRGPGPRFDGRPPFREFPDSLPRAPQN